MNQPKIAETHWYADQHLIITHLSGEVDETDIMQWENSLRDALGLIEKNGSFSILVNLSGFNAAEVGAHKKFRSIIPLTLAQYGWKVGYVDLFKDEANTIHYTHTRGITCLAAAHCHHDPTKMERYQTLFSSSHEHFFTDPREAEQWIAEKGLG